MLSNPLIQDIAGQPDCLYRPSDVLWYGSCCLVPIDSVAVNIFVVMFITECCKVAYRAFFHPYLETPTDETNNVWMCHMAHN